VAENQLKPLRLDNFIANLPCMAFQLLLDPNESFSFSYIGEGSEALLGISPADLAADVNLFISLVVPEDRPAFTKA